MVTIVKLDTGVKLILDKMNSVKSVSVGIWCGTGSVNENPKEYGISHFIEHMLFKGTKNRSSFQIVQEMDSIGAEINAFTSKEKTCFFAKCIDENLFKAADVLADMVENPLFDAEELEKEKLVVIEEINMNADDPDSVAIDEFDNLIFQGTSIAHPILGTKENIKSFDRDFLNNYYYNHYTRDNIVVSIAGSFDEEKVIEYFSNRFLNLNERKVSIGFIDMGLNNPEKLVVKKDIEQAHIVIGLTTVSATDKNRYNLSVLSTLMGGGMSSRLFQHIREDKGLAYSVYSSNSFYKETGEFGICAGVAKDRVDEFLEAVKLELDKLKTTNIEKSEFDTALMQLKSSYIYSLENTMTRMRTNGTNYFALGYCPDQQDTIELLNSITLDDIENCKELISDYDKYSIVIVTGEND